MVISINPLLTECPRNRGKTNVGYGEMERVTLHPVQLRFLAEHAGLLKPAPTARLPRGFRRRLERLRDHVDNLHQLLASVPCYPPGSGETKDVAAASALADEFDDLLVDYFDDEAIQDAINQSNGSEIQNEQLDLIT
ncbi:MAG: hypothetical protein ABI144_10530 [Gallionella sp.]